MKTDTIMNHVLPDVILWKESSTWMCFRNEAELDEGNAMANQELYEPFNDFIKRVIKIFMDEEDNGIGLAEGMFKCVHIDYCMAEVREQEEEEAGLA